MNSITDNTKDTKRSDKSDRILKKIDNSDNIIITHLLLPPDTKRNKQLPKVKIEWIVSQQDKIEKNTGNLNNRLLIERQNKLTEGAASKNVAIPNITSNTTNTSIVNTQMANVGPTPTLKITVPYRKKTDANQQEKVDISVPIKNVSTPTPLRKYNIRRSVKSSFSNTEAQKCTKQLTNSLTPTVVVNSTNFDNTKKGSTIAKERSSRTNSNLKSFSTATPPYKPRTTYRKGSFNSAVITNKDRKTTTTTKNITTTVPKPYSYLCSTKKKTNEVTLPRKTISLSKPQQPLATGQAKEDNIAPGLPKATTGGLYNVKNTGFVARMEKAQKKTKMPICSLDPYPPTFTSIFGTPLTVSSIYEQKFKDLRRTGTTQKNLTPQPAVHHILKSSTTASLPNRVANKNANDADIVSVEKSNTGFNRSVHVTHKCSENVTHTSLLPQQNTSVNWKGSIVREPLETDIANLKRQDSERNLLLRRSAGSTNLQKSKETSTTAINLQQQSTTGHTTYNRRNVLWIKKPEGKIISINEHSLKDESAANTQAGPPANKDNILEVKKAKPVPTENFKCNDLMCGSNIPEQGDPTQKSKKLEVSPSLMDILCDGGLKIKPRQNIRNTVVKYFAAHPSVTINLISIIDEIRDLPVFSSAVRCLYQLVMLSQLQEGGKMFNVMDYMKSVNFAVLVNSICTVPNRLSHDSKFNAVSIDLYTKLLKVINVLCKNSQCRIQIKRINPQTLQFLCNLLKEQASKEMVTNLLDIFQIICGAKRNCRFLSFQQFYDSLRASYKLTRKLISVINILQLMVKSKTAFKYMGQQEQIINLLLDFISYHNKAPFSRCAVTNILHKLADNEKVLETLFKPENYTKLYNYFAKCKEKDERHCRIKIYSILNRFNNTTLLLNTKLNITLGLSDDVMHNLNAENLSRNEESESDWESDEESSDENDSDDSYSSLDLLNSETENIIPLSSMQKYFVEYFPDTANFSKLDIFEPSDTLLSSSIIEQRVTRSANLGSLAFPDAAMLSPDSDKHTITAPEFPLRYLTQKLKTIQTATEPAFISKTVFHLDELYLNAQDVLLPHPNSYDPLSRCDQPVGDSLQFESRFECGNLRKAIQVEKYEYNLTLSPDTLTIKGFQWFYFQVSNMLAEVDYTFNIVNFATEKNAYNEGMLPVMFSAADYQLNGNSWKRAGNNVIFHGNHYTNKTGSVQYRSLTFSIKFPFSCDYVYIAYHYPYTYTRLMVTLYPYYNFKSTRIYTRLDKLCNTVNNKNEVPLLTITASPYNSGSLFIPLHKRPIIILTARVHPGESNASWIMEGIIKYLLNETNPNATLAREYYVFKIIPMLNPEGVIYGNTRRGLTGNDLNRCWSKPNDILCPEIFYAKKLIEYAKTESRIPIGAYIDIHGHSNKKHVFLYGCNPKQSWNTSDHEKGDWLDVLEILPKAIQAINPNIQLSQCKYDITKSREKTGRVVMWRELGITQSYTLECSCFEAYRNQSITTKLLTDVGESVVSAMGRIADKLYKSKQSLPSFGLDYGNMDDWDMQPPSHSDNSSDQPVQSTSANANPLESAEHVRYYFPF